MRSRSAQRGVLEGVALYAVLGLGAALLLSWAAAGISVKYLNSKLAAAEAQVVQKEGERAAEEQSRKGFQAAGEACGKSVAKLEAEAEARKAAFDAGQAASRARTRSAEAQVAALLSAPRPAGLDECQAAKKILDDEIDRRHQ